MPPLASYQRRRLDDMNAQSIKRGICDALSNVDVSSSFACSSVLESFPYPAIFIQGLGTVGLPLSARDAQAIANSAFTQQSPFGKGSETLVDTSIRKSWQIDPAHFHIQNPQFNSKIDSIVRAAVKDLNVPCGPDNVTAELYKLLLYEEGAFFLPHQDGEKVDGMFGTLMICLPSVHTGGEIYLSHGGRQRTVSTSEASEFDYSFAAWYSDVTHEIKPVTSGNRLVLIYNLVQASSGPTITASVMTDSKRRLKNVLSHWNAACTRQNPDIPGMLAYKLSHKYSKSGLSCRSLKGSDYVKFQHLNQCCADEDFLLYLAHIEKEVTGSCDESGYWENDYWDDGDDNGPDGYDEDSESDGEDGDNPGRKETDRSKAQKDLGGCHEIIDDISSWVQLTRVIDQNGAEIAKNVEIEIEDIAQGDIFKRAPDDEDYSGFTGNEGVSTTHFYHDTVMLLIPRKYRLDLDLRSAETDPDRIVHWIRSLQDDLISALDESKRLQLERICDLVVQRDRKISSSFRYYSRPNCRSRDMLMAVVDAALQLDDILLLEDAVQLLGRDPPVEIFASIRQAIPKLGFTTLKLAFEMCLKHMTHIESKWSALLQVAGEPFPTSDHQKDAKTALVEHWIRAQLGHILSPYSGVTIRDGVALADMANRFGVEMLNKQIAPYVEGKLENTSFVMTFLFSLFGLRESSQIPASIVDEVYSRILSKMVTRFDLGCPEQRLPLFDYRSGHSIDRGSHALSSSVLMQTLQQCEVLSLNSQVGSLLLRIQDSALKARKEAFESLLLPYVTLLLAHLRKGAAFSLAGNECREHVSMILQAYIIRFVRPQPKRPLDWSLSPTKVKCKCHDCLELKAFIRDGNRQMCQFRMIQRRRTHLEKQLFSKDFQYETVRSSMPHILVITKVHAVYQQEHSEWQTRFKRAQKCIQQLDTNPWLEQVLGDKYDEIVNMRCADKPLSTIETGAGVKSTTTVFGPLSGNKRKEIDPKEAGHASQNKRTKTNFIDLTSE